MYFIIPSLIEWFCIPPSITLSIMVSLLDDKIICFWNNAWQVFPGVSDHQIIRLMSTKYHVDTDTIPLQPFAAKCILNLKTIMHPLSFVRKWLAFLNFEVSSGFTFHFVHDSFRFDGGFFFHFEIDSAGRKMERLERILHEIDQQEKKENLRHVEISSAQNQKQMLHTNLHEGKILCLVLHWIFPWHGRRLVQGQLEKERNQNVRFM